MVVRNFVLLLGSERSRLVFRGTALLMLFLGVGCALGPKLADRSFESGEYLQATRKYEAYLQENPSGPGRERALFRLVLLYSSPDTPVHDEERSEALRTQLVEQYPGGPYASWVSWQLFLERRVGVLKENLEAAESRIEKLGIALQGARGDSARNRALLEAMEKELDERLAEMRVLEGQLATARNEATSQKERMERLTEALELLKAIDLKRTP